MSRLRCFLVLLFAAGLARAVPPDGAPVGKIDIRFRNGRAIDETFVRSFLSTEVGAPLSRRALADDVRSLLDSRAFSYAAVATDDFDDGGACVIYTLEARRRLASQPEFTGLHRFGASKARKTTDLKAGDFVDEDLVRAAAEKLRSLYLKDRYFEATVTPHLKPLKGSEGNVLLTFEVREGDRVHVDFLTFPGATVFTESALGRLACQHDWYNPQSWVINPRVTDVDLDLVQSDALAQYLDAGYLDATVSAPRKSLDGDRLAVAFDVAEGPVYHVDSIGLEGTTLFPESVLRSALGLRKGDVAGTSALDGARKALREYYASRGYADTVVKTTTKADPAKHTLSVVFHVEEGALVHVRSIQIRGNTATKDKVIRREIGLVPGATYDTVQAERSRRRLLNLGYFEDVRLYDTVAAGDSRDVYFDVVEKPTGHINFGAGFSSVDHLVGIFGVSQSNFDLFNWHNFRGGGQKARLDLTMGRDSTDLDASIVEPWFLDRRLSLAFDVFINTRDYSEYEDRRWGTTIGLEKMVPWVGRVGLSYTLAFVSLKDVITDELYLADHPDIPFSYLDEEDDYRLGSLKLSWTYDTRDNSIVPTRGTRATAHAALYNSAFGSSFDFYELNLKAYKYFQLPFGLRLALSGRAATVDGIGEDEVPIGSRYFLGGGRYVRGFRHRDIGPKAIYKETPQYFSAIGGQSLLWGTAEVSVPLASMIRLAAFYDIGNVWEDAYDFDFSEYASSVGVGLRFDMVGFPIRLDYAHALEKDDDLARTREFVFWIGFDN